VFVRRLDDQVKVDGFRIELAEIESVFGAHPWVKQAVVVVRDGRLVGYLQPSEGRVLSSAELSSIREAAARSLTHYMMPK
jgi:acyl-coenzyme A synthetase/AMP-(fatty) acid ligase